MQLLIFRKQTAWTTHFSAANSSPSSLFFISIRNSQPKSTYFVHRACIHSYSCEEGIFVTRNSSISQGRCSLFVFLLDLTKLCCGLNRCSCLLCTASPCTTCCSPCRRSISPCIPLPLHSHHAIFIGSVTGHSGLVLDAKILQENCV